MRAPPVPFIAKGLLLNLALTALVLIVLAGLWVFIAPKYNEVLTTLAQRLAPPSSSVQARGNELVLVYDHPTLSRPASARVNGLTLHGGLLLMLAIVLGTPHMPVIRRVLWSSAFITLFLAFHALTLIFLTWALKWGAEGSRLNLTSITPFIPLVYVVVPAMAAGVWCLRYWLPRTPK